MKLLVGPLLGAVLAYYFGILDPWLSNKSAEPPPVDRRYVEEEKHAYRLPESLGSMDLQGTWAVADGTDEQMVSRWTSNLSRMPIALLSSEQSPVAFGGLQYNSTKLARGIVALSGQSWPTWTLIHHAFFELDLNRLEKRLWQDQEKLKMHEKPKAFVPGVPTIAPSSSADHPAEIMFLTARYKNGSLSPRTEDLSVGLLETRVPHVAMVRSALLLESGRQGMIGFRRDGETKTVRKLAPHGTVATLEDAMSIAVHKANIKVIHWGEGGPVEPGSVCGIRECYGAARDAAETVETVP